MNPKRKLKAREDDGGRKATPVAEVSVYCTQAVEETGFPLYLSVSFGDDHIYRPRWRKMAVVALKAARVVIVTDRGGRVATRGRIGEQRSGFEVTVGVKETTSRSQSTAREKAAGLTGTLTSDMTSSNVGASLNTKDTSSRADGVTVERDDRHTYRVFTPMPCDTWAVAPLNGTSLRAAYTPDDQFCFVEYRGATKGYVSAEVYAYAKDVEITWTDRLDAPALPLPASVRAVQQMLVRKYLAGQNAVRHPDGRVLVARGALEWEIPDDE